MQRDFDIIFLSLCRWDDPFSSTSFSLAKQFAKNNRVFYIDHPFTVKDFVSAEESERVSKRKEALLFGSNMYTQPKGLPSTFTVVTPRMTFPINWISNEAVYNSVSKLNDAILFTAIKKTIKDFGIRKYIFINSFDPFFARKFPAFFKPILNIYQTVDDISQEGYIAKHGIRLEREAVSKADITFATSKELTRIKSKLSGKIFYLPNAADISLFKKAITETYAKPKEISNTSKKVIIYTGNIGLRLDYNLLRKVALVHKDKILLMVGPTGNEDYKKAGLDKMSNVIFTGKKDLGELPAYLQHADCAIIPFEHSTLTKSIYPLKINEYLASGKPVVTTDFSDDIKDFKDAAYVSRNDQEFLAMIGKAMQEDSIERQRYRVRVAESNSWEARVDKFWQVVNQVLDNKIQAPVHRIAV